MKKYALLSVSDKSGIVEFAQALVELNYSILSSSGTAKALIDAGIAVEKIEDYTGQEEILGGRVKTLHPKIHAGILAKREEDHLKDLAKIGAGEIEVIACNLYPFKEHLASDSFKDFQKMIEYVDIGGPAMLRAGAKNFPYVYSISNPADYPAVIECIKANDSAQAIKTRKDLAVKIFTQLADYNLQIASYFSAVDCSKAEQDHDPRFTTVNGLILDNGKSLRYGENPHQSAIFYKDYNKADQQEWEQLAGKELSYNNILDLDAAIGLIRKMPAEQISCAIFKHLNPCGIAIADSTLAAIHKAKESDPRSHFGGIIAFNKLFDEQTAQEVIKDFAEIVIAPDFSVSSLEILKSKKNLRIIAANLSPQNSVEWRSTAGGFLCQESDNSSSNVSEGELQTSRQHSSSEAEDLALAWTAVSCVKSNAIVIVKNGQLLASGAGQMSRIDSTELAINKAISHGHDLNGAVCASDAFFPFPDSVEKLAEVGIKAIITTGGSMADAEVIKTAEQLELSLIFTKDRHFKH